MVSYYTLSYLIISNRTSYLTRHHHHHRQNHHTRTTSPSVKSINKLFNQISLKRNNYSTTATYSTNVQHSTQIN